MISTFSRLTGGTTSELSASLFAEMTGGGKKNSIVDVRVPISTKMKLPKSTERKKDGGASIRLTDASIQISRQNPDDISLEPEPEKKKKYLKKVPRSKSRKSETTGNKRESIKNEYDV